MMCDTLADLGQIDRCDAETCSIIRRGPMCTAFALLQHGYEAANKDLSLRGIVGTKVALTGMNVVHIEDKQLEGTTKALIIE